MTAFTKCVRPGVLNTSSVILAGHQTEAVDLALGLRKDGGKRGGLHTMVGCIQQAHFIITGVLGAKAPGKRSIFLELQPEANLVAAETDTATHSCLQVAIQPDDVLVGYWACHASGSGWGWGVVWFCWNHGAQSASTILSTSSPVQAESALEAELEALQWAQISLLRILGGDACEKWS